MSHHRVLLGAAVPLFLSMIAGVVAHVVGAAVLGNQSAATLAAFALVTAVLTPATAAVAGGLRGMAPFIAPHRESPARAMAILRDARWLAMVIGTLGAAVVACVPLIARASGVPAEVRAEMGALPFLLAFGVLVFAFGGGANAALIALGRSRQVLWSSLTGFSLEVVLIVVLVPRLGAVGAGVALVLSGAVGFAVANACLLRVPGLGGQSLWPGRPRPREILALARVGIPMSGTVLIKFAVLGVVTYVAAGTGARNAAAHAVLTALLGFLFIASLAVAQASVPEIARAGDTREARRINRAGLLLGTAGAGLVAVVMLVFGAPLVGLFTADPAVSAVVVALIPLMLLSTLAEGWQAMMGFGLTALKRSTWSMGSFAIAYGLLASAAVPVASAWGLTGLWVALVVTNVLLVLLQGGGFHRHSARIGRVSPHMAEPRSSAA